METRKSIKADLERKRPVMLQLGLIIALSATLAAFEWKTPDYGNIVLPPARDIPIDDGFIDIYVKKNVELPKPMNTTLIKEVDNQKTDLNEIEITTEIDPMEGLPPFVIPELTEENTTENSNDIFVVVQKMPQFPGGEAALFRFLSTNIKYPQQAREAGISGTVYVTFVIEPDGRVSSATPMRSIPGGLTEEALRVINLMPVWEPGRQMGKAVRVKINLPVKFTLVN